MSPKFIKKSKAAICVLIAAITLQGCAGAEIPIVIGAAGAAAAAKGVAKTGEIITKAVVTGISRSLSCSFAKTDHSIALPTEETEFYKEILNTAEANNASEANFYSVIGPENSSKLIELLKADYAKMASIFSLEQFQNLMARAFVYISKTPDSEKFNWTIRQTFTTEVRKQNVISHTTETLSLRIMLHQGSSKIKMNYYSFCD